MNKSALAVSLVAALFAIVLGVVYVNKAEKELSGGDKVSVVTVTSDLTRGQPLRPELLATRGVPIAYVETRAVRAADLERVVGLAVAHKLEPGHTLMWTDLEILQEERRDLSQLIAPGKRAYTITTRGPAHASRLIQPGDYADVLGTVSTDADERSVVLLQKVLVLAVGERTVPKAHSAGGTERSQALTLSLDLRESQLIALAQQKGTLRVVLRNPDDHRIIDDMPDVKASALSNTRSRPRLERGLVRTSPVRLMTK